MSKLLPTNSNNPCPICGKTNGDCRLKDGKDNYVLCMTYADKDSYNKNGYKYVGYCNNGLWGEYSKTDPKYQKSNTDNHTDNSHTDKKLTNYELDQQLRELFNSLKLSKQHKQELLKRGFSEDQIKAQKFCSITGFHRLPNTISHKIAGTFRDKYNNLSIGNSTVNYIICPVRNNNQFLGYQKRRSDNADGNKYIWAKTFEKKDQNGKLTRNEVTSHLTNGELPLAYYPSDNPKTLYLCDSVAIKPYLAHCKHKISIAGIAGLTMLNKHKEQLLPLITEAERAIYCPDAGDIDNKKFWQSMLILSDFIIENNPKIELEIAWWNQEDKDKDKDIDQLDNLSYIEIIDYESFKTEYSPDNHYNKYREQSNKFSGQSDISDKESDTVKITKLIKAHFGENFKYNELTSEIELNDNIVGAEFDNLYIELGEKYNCDLPKQKTYDCAVNIAKEKSYHPVKNYLNSLDFRANPEYIEIEKLAELLFNINNPLYDKMIRKWMIAAVARIYNSSCKVDNMLILKGNQGLMKSTFFRVLFGGEWFTDNLTSNLSRDDLLTCHKHWCIEMDELDRITSKKEAGAVKAFITKQRDDFRKPYGKSSLSYKRRFVLCGTCNKDEFLVDETGNRRFWIIPIIEKINVAYIKEIRDWLWAMAKYWYLQGEQWWLSDEDETLLTEMNKSYEIEDSWQVLIKDYISDWTTVNLIFDNALDLDEKDHTKQNQMRVTAILKRLGYSKTIRRINGKRTKVWSK